MCVSSDKGTKWLPEEYESDGLNTLEYKLKSVERRPLFTWIYASIDHVRCYYKEFLAPNLRGVAPDKQGAFWRRDKPTENVKRVYPNKEERAKVGRIDFIGYRHFFDFFWPSLLVPYAEWSEGL